MLRAISEDVRRHYYDPELHGFDFDGRVKEAEVKINSATSLGQAFTIIAWALDGLGDSHTYFVPPGRTMHTDYGWDMQMVGDHCYVTRVRPGSDAEAKGLKPGDEILSLYGTPPSREGFPSMRYFFYILSPKNGLRVVVKGSDGQERQLDLLSKVRQLKRQVDLSMFGSGVDINDMRRESEDATRLLRTRCSELGEAYVCKMPEFIMDYNQAESLLKDVRKHKSFVFDLRGNPGGSVDTLAWLLGGFFDHTVTIGQRVGRKEMKPQATKRQHDAFPGKVVVLVDSQSSSAAEIFARVMQLEKRGIVVGDRSSGLVMEGKFYSYTLGADSRVFYGALITDADIVMSDGKSLEHTGVTPDEIVLPAPVDLLKGRDPALSRALELAGATLSPEQAGKMFPYEWPKD
jgi:C-terminal processing protease CtpA/Prc